MVFWGEQGPAARLGGQELDLPDVIDGGLSRRDAISRSTFFRRRVVESKRVNAVVPSAISTSCGNSSRRSDGKPTRFCHVIAPEPMTWPLARASCDLACGFKGRLDFVSKKTNFSQESSLLGGAIRNFIRTHGVQLITGEFSISADSAASHAIAFFVLPLLHLVGSKSLPPTSPPGLAGTWKPGQAPQEPAVGKLGISVSKHSCLLIFSLPGRCE